jgi:hypothetical protein
MAESALRALAILRDPAGFQWYVVSILIFVIYIYYTEIGRGNWSVVLAGLALWGADWFNEIVNALVLHFSGYAPIWGAPAGTAYLILVGLNIEIMFMFAVMGIAAVKLLPADKKRKIFGIPNRLFYALLSAAMAVGVEILLNLAGALTWEYAWWSARFPFLIFIFGYLHFFLIAFWVYDMEKIRQKAAVVGALLGLDALALVLFGAVLGWI